MSLKLNEITVVQKKRIENGLIHYDYIMKNIDKNDVAFRCVYIVFYQLAENPRMKKHYDEYFEMLSEVKSDKDEELFNIIKKLKGITDSYQFSFATKMLHTRFPNKPIYDRVVRDYLVDEKGVILWNRKGAPRGTSKEEIISHDWKILCDWYTEFIPSEEGQEWINWFDKNFPDYTKISDVKKVDFIIWGASRK